MRTSPGDRGRGELLAKSDLEVSVGGYPRNFSYNVNPGFSYNVNPGALSLARRRMKEGRHRVEITATDSQYLPTTKSWTFKVGVNLSGSHVGRGPVQTGPLPIA
jgi:hypothetical protein